MAGPKIAARAGGRGAGVRRAGLDQLGQRRVERGQMRDKRGLGGDLVPHHRAQRAARPGQKDEAANVGQGGGVGRQKCALGMADEPDAGRAGLGPEAGGPCDGVLAVGRECDGIRVAAACADAALVDAQRGDAMGRQPLGQQAVGVAGDAEGRIAVPVGGAGAGQDQGRDAGRRIGSLQRAVKRAEGAVDRHGCGICRRREGAEQKDRQAVQAVLAHHTPRQWRRIAFCA